MKTLIFASLLMVSHLAMAEDKYGNLDKEDQKFFANDSREGKNQMERIDSNVRQINQMIGEMQKMKSEIAKLRSEVDELKEAKK
jgi:polyhydroxyalkanoate synthesis regulator phasin